MDRIEAAARAVELIDQEGFDSSIWTAGDKVRVYIKGYEGYVGFGTTVNNHFVGKTFKKVERAIAEIADLTFVIEAVIKAAVVDEDEQDQAQSAHRIASREIA